MKLADKQPSIVPRHPAKYSDEFIPIFAEELPKRGKILDPFAGTGKIYEIKNMGFAGLFMQMT